jgi:hypothetical protein
MADRQFVHKHDEVQLAKVLRESKPLLDQYGTTIIYALAAILAVSAVVVYIARQPPQGAESSRNLMLASTAEDYRDVADEAGETLVGQLARLKQAELTLNTAMGDMFANRAVGLEQLQTAEAAYTGLSKASGLPKEARLRVLNGLARIAEARCDGSDASINAAVAAWELLLKESGDAGMFKELAESRIKQLPLESTRQFYAWFHKQDPKPADDENLPQDGPPKTVPDIPSIDLGLPDLTTPVPGTTTPDPSTPAETTPGTEGTPAGPTDDAPATAADPAAVPAGTEPAATDPAAPSTEPEPASETPAPPAPAGDAPAVEAPVAPTEPAGATAPPAAGSPGE